jgi:hypothetical protein
MLAMTFISLRARWTDLTVPEELCTAVTRLLTCGIWHG